MYVPIRVVRHRSTIRATVERQVNCEACHTAFSYHLTREFVGSSFLGSLGLDKTATARATAEAQEVMDRSLASAVDPVICPACGVLTPSLRSSWRKQQFMQAFGPFAIAGFTFWVVGFFAELPASRLVGLAIAAAGLVFGIVAASMDPQSPRRRLWPFPAVMRGSTSEQRLTRADAESARLMASDSDLDRWSCPRCSAVNPNNTFRCKDCKYSLV
ncbi:MAG: hypothetical protein IPK07_24660 [Deltaproteobacteria bacterium]|nr:hypothetical protein [Deltaproteobacteria bacterium]